MDEEKSIVPETPKKQAGVDVAKKNGSKTADVTAPAPEIKVAGPLSTDAGADSGAPSRKLARPAPSRSRRRKNRWWLWLIVLLVAAGAGVGAYFIWFRPAQTTGGTVVQTNTVSNTSVVSLSVSATGQVQAKADLSLTFGSAGTVTEILVKQGDTVKKGQPLAKIDDRDLQSAVKTSQASLNSAKANFEKTKAGATEIDIKKAEEQLKQARLNAEKTRNGTATAADIQSARSQVNSARANLEQVKAGGSDYDKAVAQSNLSTAQSNLSSAQAKYESVMAGPDAVTLSAAQLKVDQAQTNLEKTKSSLYTSVVNATVSRDQALNALQKAQDAYSSIYNQNRNADGTLKSGVKDADIQKETDAYRSLQDAQGSYNRADVALNDAKVSYDVGIRNAQGSLEDAKLQLEKVKAGPTQTDIAAAKASLDQAQASVDNAKLNIAKLSPTELQLAQAQASYDSSMASLSKLTSGGTATDIEIAESNLAIQEMTLQNLKNGPTTSDLATQQASLDVAQANYDKAVAQLDNAVIKAPYDGIVAALSLVPGQVVAASTAAVQLIDTSELRVDVNVGESDISKIKLNQAVVLNFDSISGRSFTGKVTFIAPKATVSNNVVNYVVSVTLDQQGKNSLQDAFPEQYQKYLTALQSTVRQGVGGRAGAQQSPGAAGTGAATTAAGTQTQGGQAGPGQGRQGGQAGQAGGAGSFQLPAGVQIPAEFQAQAASLRASLGFCGFTPTLGGGANAAQTQPKVGMTASVTLCLDARAGVLSVPTRAIKTETASGQITRYVEVQDEQGNKVKKTVTLGLQGDSSTEITGGELKEGDKVITGTSSTNRTNTQQNNPLSGGGGPQQIRIGG